MVPIADRLASSPAARRGVQLLRGDLDKFDRLSGRRTLEAVSEWPDEITGTPAARPRWHYDEPRSAAASPGALCATGNATRSSSSG